MQETPLKLFNQHLESQVESPIQESTKYMTVTCRLKPLLYNQVRSKIEVDKQNHAITLNDPNKSISKTYSFDEIFDQSVCQDRFTNNICQPIIKFLKNGGQSGLIFSYGITNSGKTYTILGTKEQPGILLSLIKKLEDQFKGEIFRIVACQLYKDEFYSLKNKGEKFQPKELRGTFSFQECNSDIINEKNMEELFSQYLINRSSSSTIQNSTSSRSHAIFKIFSSKFKIGIVDLAGSERTSKGKPEYNDIKETIFINKSLLTLKKCIKALQERSGIVQEVIVPYRESKLTQALMEYFVPTSKINIIVNINQAKHCLEQNLSAMDYTSKAKNITANATSNFAMMLKSTAKKKQALISALKNHKKLKSEKITQNNQIMESQIKRINQKSSKKVLSQSQNQNQQVQQYNSLLYPILQLNEKKASQKFSTTINSNSNECTIEEIEYEEFNPIKEQLEKKLRYSIQLNGCKERYIVEEEMIESQNFQEFFGAQIQKQERASYRRQKQNQLSFRLLVQNPLQIQQFIHRQQMFRNYLAYDRQIEAEQDARKLSAMKKVNLLESTNKKINLTVINQSIDIAVGTEDLPIQIDEQTQRIRNIKISQLRTSMKKRLLEVLDEDKKKVLIDAERVYSEQKRSEFRKAGDKLEDLKLDQVQQNQQQSNFTTPPKNLSKNSKNLQNVAGQNEKIIILSAENQKSFLKKTFQKVTSGVKFMVDKVGTHVFRTNHKQIRNCNQQELNHNRKGKLKIWKQMSERINPMNKVYYEFYTNTEVDIFPSVKKAQNQSQQHQIDQFFGNDDNFNLEKIEDMRRYDVGIQTDHVELKHVYQDAIDDIIQQRRKKKANLHKGRLCIEQKKQTQQKALLEKTAFKSFSVKKDHQHFSLKKREQVASNAKMAIAKNTRAQRRKKGLN